MKVWIGKVDSYRRDEVEAAVQRGLQYVSVPLGSRVAAKCNWVLAHPSVGRHCYTRPEIVSAALEALVRPHPERRLTFIGNSGAGVPTAVMARRAQGEDPRFRARGFWTFPRLYPGQVFIKPTDESELCTYELSLGEPMAPEQKDRWDVELSPSVRYWNRITTSAELRDADTLIWFPKLKTNVLSNGLTGACKLGGIGLLLDDYRMDGHNFHNDRRIADMLEVACPDLIVTDGVEVAWGGNQMTEPGRALGVILMADNPVAHDLVACHLFGLDAEQVHHVRLAAERGWGPRRFSEVDVVSEVPLPDLQRKVFTFGANGFVHVERFAEKFRQETGAEFPLEVISGPPYEHAGAQGVFLDWLYFSCDFARSREAMKRWPRAAVLIGEFERMPTDPSARVYAVGNRACQTFLGKVQVLRRIRIPSFIHRVVRGPREFVRYLRPDGGTGWAILIEGDPPTHRDLILGFMFGSGFRMIAPFVRLDLILDSYFLMLGTWLRCRLNNRRPPARVRTADVPRMRRHRPAFAGVPA